MIFLLQSFQLGETAFGVLSLLILIVFAGLIKLVVAEKKKNDELTQQFIRALQKELPKERADTVFKEVQKKTDKVTKGQTRFFKKEG